MLGQNTRIFSTMCRWEGGGGEIPKGRGGREGEIPRDLALGGEIPWDFAAGGGGGARSREGEIPGTPVKCISC